jgi:hypothetical protein
MRKGTLARLVGAGTMAQAVEHLPSKDKICWVLVAHACNPSYLGDRLGESWFEASLGK